ncbi:PQQ-dependent sugar dehydrogenase [Pareuzebyella sediminis]|uniref:PQQ-dependent sugar dehydrogenase n=1 Tax=Pareuzebyella sediminis TaxID=2607998 RepID=UPI0011EF293B|nr:PQQ-dependent sugar dehydrogenase [Pareuzebyella sediminis]
MKYVYFLLFLGIVFGCKDGQESAFGSDISEDPANISKGKTLFAQHCSACHNFKNTGIGPALGGITTEVSTEWLKKMITDASALLAANDSRATTLKERFMTVMPSFTNLDSTELNALLAYMHTKKKNSIKGVDQPGALTDPIPNQISFDSIPITIQYLAQVPASSEKSPLARINKIGCEPNSGRLFTNDLRGILYEITDTVAKPFFNLRERQPHFISEPGLATGFGSFAFHPDFERNGLLYTTHTEPKGTATPDFTYADSIPKRLQWVLKEWKVEDFQTPKIAIKSRELLRIDFYGTIHGMQEIAFNPDANRQSIDYGKLYIGLGDGSSVENGHKEIAHHHGNGVWSSILRIDPLGNNSSNNMYGIPEDNPFAKHREKIGEVWAYGFRNPNRLSWDGDGALYATDIGHNNIEELNRILPGHFYGWPIREGTFLLNPDQAMDKLYPLPEDDEQSGVTYPVLQYDHSEGAAISGGFFVKKGSDPQSYIFGDIPTGYVYKGDVNSGRIYRLNVSLNDTIKTFAAISGAKRVDLRLGSDCAGSGYLFTKADGKIYKMMD